MRFVQRSDRCDGEALYGCNNDVFANRYMQRRLSRLGCDEEQSIEKNKPVKQTCFHLLCRTWFSPIFQRASRYM